MDSKKLIAVMAKILKLHQSLYSLADRKTDIIKKGDMEALTQLLKEEQAHITAINRLEGERESVTSRLVPVLDKPSISDCLNVLEGTEKENLQGIRSELINTIQQIKQKNDVNQQLIFQSLQFVNLSLDLVAPKNEEFNYGPPAGKQNEALRPTGMFNTKA